MRALTGPQQAHYSGSVLTIARRYDITRTDGVVVRLTTYPASQEVGGEVYSPLGGVSATASQYKASLATSTQQISGFLTSDLITEVDLIAGLYDGAIIEVWEYDYTDPDAWQTPIDLWYVGEVTLRRGVYAVETASLSSALDQEVGDRRGPTCRNTLGVNDGVKSFCPVLLDPPAWQASSAYALGDSVKATVYDGRRYVCTDGGTSDVSEPVWDTTIDNTTTDSSVTWTCKDAWTKQLTVTNVPTDRKNFEDSGLLYADGWFNGGVLTWTSGLNTGIRMDVKRSLLTGEFALKFSMPFDIQSGDTANISAGCNLLLKMPGDAVGSPYTGDCRTRYDAVVAFNGEPESMDAALAANA